MKNKELTVYLVGGAVRDFAMGNQPNDKDYVVVGATEEQMLDLGYVRVGKDFPVFLHPTTREEYALARTERKTGKGHTGFEFTTSNITLEEDLLRRDFTMNAMALSGSGTVADPYKVIDPYGGQEDIHNNVLRQVNDDSFVEDPLRVLRAGRFLARYKDLEPHPQLVELCAEIVSVGMLQELTAERIWKEISRGVCEPFPRKMFDFLLEVGALGQIAPEIARLKGVPQVAVHHPEVDTFEHVMLCMEEAAKADLSLVGRMAVLLHDLGKGTTSPEVLPRHIAHEIRGVKLVENLAKRWKLPRAISDAGKLMSREHTQVHQIFKANKTTVLALIFRADGVRRRDHLVTLLQACKCDAKGRLGKSEEPYPQADYILEVRDAIARTDVGAIVRKYDGDVHCQKYKQSLIQAHLKSAAPVFEKYKQLMIDTKRYPFVPELCKRYIALLDAQPKEDSDNPMENSHLVWMLNQLQMVNYEHTKKHRWLGYVQGIMVAKGLINVNEERELTRPIFKETR